MRKWIYRDGLAIEVTADYATPLPSGPFIVGEIDAYQSPVDGRVIDSRAKRRDDLARHGCRPWEGLAAEQSEAARYLRDEQAKSDSRIDEGVQRAYHQLDPRKREILRGAR